MLLKKHIVFLFVGIFSFFSLNAQKTTNKPAQITAQSSIDDDERGEPVDMSIVIPSDFESSLDYLLYSWAVDRNLISNCAEKPNPPVTEDQYRSRLKKLPHVIEMPYNAIVQQFINVYTNRRRKEVEYMLSLSKYYFPIFEQALNAAKLPLELKYLPIIESALIPTAVSRAGAGGLWQFMIATGRMYDMEINSLVDERFDPIKSTAAAVKYLRELFEIYEDWNLALAAYNCGPGNVNKAIRRSGGKEDFWEIYPYLPRETRGYVPIFIAANYTLSYYKEHNLCPAKTFMPTLTDTIMVRQRMHFEQIAAVLDLPMEEIRLLNPQYRSDLIPGDIKPYSVCLPLSHANKLIEKMEEVLAYKADEFNARRYETPTPISNVVYQPQPKRGQQRATLKKEEEFVAHTVRSGQTLGGIAKTYRVTVAQIKRWNNMGEKSTIKSGQSLKIRKR